MNYRLSIFYILIILCLSPSVLLYAQKGQPDNQEQEVYLSFLHRGAVDQMISSYYDSRRQIFYLPLTELFNALGIDYNVQQAQLSISGQYLDTGSEYTFDFKEQYATFQDHKIELTADDYRVKELDFYVKPRLLNQLLDLRFNVDFSNLSLALESDYTMPVVAELQRKRRRQQEIEDLTVEQEDFPLHYKRNRSYLDGAFLDYNLSSNFTDDLNLYTYNFNAGAELLAGDIQGRINGAWSRENSSLYTSNLRWRYVMRNNDWLSRIRLGQSITEGFQSRSFTGLKLSNEPIEPRISFDEYVVQGQTRPQSEVELYLNNNLIDYQEADELGNYRFVIPLTYGSSRLRIRIYGPDGGIREFNRRILVPFNFQKPGKFRYSFSAGKLDRPLFGTSERGHVMQSEARMGINRNLTAGGGFEYLEPIHTQRPLVYGTFSSRLFSNYLINADIAPDAYYRLQTNTVYASSAGWGLDYTYYPTDNFYNRTSNDHEMSGNIFVPFSIGSIQFNTRLLTTHRRGSGINTTRYRFDLNSRWNRFTLRVGYSDQQLGMPEFTTTLASRLTTSLTYTLSRGQSIPDLLKGTYLRGQLDYGLHRNELQRANFQLSRNISHFGRLRVSYDRSFSRDFGSLNVGLIFNLSQTRTTSTFRTNRGNVSYTQNLRGTIGYDSHNRDIVLDNRQQVGRSAASVRLFVDENNNGNYDTGEQKIKDNAVQLRRSGEIEMSDGGTIHMNQLRAYNRLNAHINTSAISNPLYIPKIEEFSFITDPNQYKPINIPFYQSGVISGNVSRTHGDSTTTEPVAGLRVKVQQTHGDFNKDLRTFSDGGFYSMEIPPGQYTVRIDSTQLNFLEVTADPPERTFQVEAKAEGDFVENLDFILSPREEAVRDTTEKKPPEEPEEPEKIAESCKYHVQMASYNYPYDAVKGALKTNGTSGKDHTVRIRYNRLYRLLSNPYPDIRPAIGKLLEMRDLIFGDAFLTSECPPLPPYVKMHVQVGALRDKQRARTFKNQASQHVTQTLKIREGVRDYRGRPTSFNLIQTRGYADWQKAFSVRDSIRQHTPYTDTFIFYQNPEKQTDFVFTTLLLAGTFETPQEARSLAGKLSDRGIDMKVFNKKEAKQNYLFYRSDHWSDIQKARQLIRTHHPELNSRVLLFKKYKTGQQPSD